MAKLTDDPKVQELIAKAEARGATTERKRINGILKESSDTAKSVTDKAQRSAMTSTIKAIKEGIREDA